MRAIEVVDRFRAELADDPDLAQLLPLADPMLQTSPPAVVGTLDAIVIRYCRARGASVELPEVTP